MSGWKGGQAAAKEDEAKLKDFESKINTSNPEQMSLLEEMKQHTKRLSDQRKNEDPRLSFSTPEFREAQRIFTENFKKNFGRPVEWGLVKKYPWSTATLMKLDVAIDVDGNPWPVGSDGKLIYK
eukprot:CAMPEP_0170133166 /NCGR_PEP_ID=MMETSP0033_2-20121228/1111_1 /TAXON_ID=195969 /ORGANISM="Dolichomastix tenuilepis, Strain CCMP3274" /LENGTH=123 /DNA_ID=CAMNT_0010368627 /DNA_START=15 /DNA_END=386 /DNA_ORIENTATION=-